MSDAKLRELERRWKETGSVEEEAAYLLERVRAGDLTWERLGLAAYCGHEGAIKAVGSTSASSLDDALAGLASLPVGEAVAFLGAVCVAVAAEALTPIPQDVDAGQRARRTLMAVDTWLRCPCERHQEAASWASLHEMTVHPQWNDQVSPTYRCSLLVNAKTSQSVVRHAAQCLEDAVAILGEARVALALQRAALDGGP